MMNSAQGDPALSALAARSGLLEYWQDVHGREHRVEAGVLRALLDALGLPCHSSAQIRESHEQLDDASGARADGAILADAGVAVEFDYRGPPNFELILERGEKQSGTAMLTAAGRVRISRIQEPGYHTLRIGQVERPLIVAPLRCPSVAQVTGQAGARLWGVTAQVYGLRRIEYDTCGFPARLTEAGDYAALAEFARAAGDAGADAVGISPVHAMFSADPSRYSPYAPSSRLFLNAAYVDPGVVLGRDAVRAATATLAFDTPASQADPGLIDWNAVLDSRMGLCRVLFERFEGGAPPSLLESFRTFRRRGGEALEDHARYEALHAHFAAILGASHGWREWPARLRDPRASAVRHYAEKLASEVGFHIFLQWLADEGMRAAQGGALEAGMTVGLITDLAIGTDPRGSHAWSRQRDILDKVSVGAAPDLYQARGQDWGLTAFSPRALREQSYAPFIETLRAALTHAGGVRIDHILGLQRMWLIPQGAAPSEGAYVRYPRDDMLRILALEAWRHRSLVIGENLGTVPEGFNECIYGRGVMGMSVLWFERASAEPEADLEGGVAFTPSTSWPRDTVAMPTTHDLPTIMGWWLARDLDWRGRQEGLGAEELAELYRVRQGDKKALCRALEQAGLGALDPLTVPPQTLRMAILSFIAAAPTPLVLAPIEDLLGEVEQPNVPGTGGPGAEHHPNWLRRQSRASRPLLDSGAVRAGMAAVARTRGRS
jgi:4-alpha-glucanotransferase